MFSAPLEMNFHVKLIWKTSGQHMLTKISLRAPKDVKKSKNGPLAGCSTENSWNRTSANIENTDMIHIDVLLKFIIEENFNKRYLFWILCEWRTVSNNIRMSCKSFWNNIEIIYWFHLEKIIFSYFDLFGYM